MDRNEEIAEDSIRLAGADGFVLQNDRERIDADMHYLIDRKVAEGGMSPAEGVLTLRLYKGYMDATHTVELQQAARRLLTPY